MDARTEQERASILRKSLVRRHSGRAGPLLPYGDAVELGDH